MAATASAEQIARPAGPPPGYLPANTGAFDIVAGAPSVTGYAGFWRRFGAAFIDGIVLTVINFALGLVLGLVLAGAGTTNTNSATVISSLLSVIINILYYPLQESSEVQATLGKRALGIKVTDLYGRRISFGRALGRTLAKWLSALILLIGYLMAAWTSRKQALHDMIAGTLVVQA